MAIAYGFSEDGTPSDAARAGIELVIAAWHAENPDAGGGVELVEGVVDLDGSGPPVREFYCTASATIEGVAFAAGTAVVFRRTPAGVWGYIVVDPWTDIAATTTTTTTEATTTTTTTEATTTTTTTAGPGTLTYQTALSSGVAGTSVTFTAAAIGTAFAARRVIVGLAAVGGSSWPYPTSVSVGGVSATKLTEGGPSSGGLSYHYAQIPTGDTADIVVNILEGKSTDNWRVAVWTFDKDVTLVDEAVANASQTAAVTTLNGGHVLGMYFADSAAEGTWSGLTKVAYVPKNTGHSSWSAASTNATGADVTATISVATVTHLRLISIF